MAHPCGAYRCHCCGRAGVSWVWFQVGHQSGEQEIQYTHDDCSLPDPFAHWHKQYMGLCFCLLTAAVVGMAIESSSPTVRVVIDVCMQHSSVWLILMQSGCWKECGEVIPFQSKTNNWDWCCRALWFVACVWKLFQVHLIVFGVCGVLQVSISSVLVQFVLCWTVPLCMLQLLSIIYSAIVLFKLRTGACSLAGTQKHRIHTYAHSRCQRAWLQKFQAQ